MTIKAIIFDLDNTIIDFQTMKHKCCEKAVKAMIKAGLKTSYKKAYAELFELYSYHGIEDHEIFNKLLKKLTGKIDYQILTHGIIAYRNERLTHLKPYPQTEQTLKALKKKGVKLGIISDAPKLQAWLRLVSMGLDNYFDHVITSNNHIRKKEPKPFKKMLKELKVKPNEAIYVGDNPTRDIKEAKRNGLLTAFAKYGSENNAKADYVLNKISDLKKIVESYNLATLN